MKRIILPGLLGAEAAACVLLCFVKISFADVFTAAMAFPFEQIGLWLRALSLSGEPGNIAATMIYALAALLPCGILLITGKRRRLYAEDWMLALLSAALFGVLYLMVNPGFITAVMGKGAVPPIGKALLGGTVYSLIAGYIVLRVLRLFSAGNLPKLERYMAVMLGILIVIFVFLAFNICFGEMLASISALRAANSGNEHLLGATYVFLVLQYLVNALPYILDVAVSFAALNLLAELRKERYSADSVAAAARMSRLCGMALTVTTLANVAFNLLQILFAKILMVVNGSVQIPVFSILFVLAALLLTRFVTENRQLKDENDSFV